MVCQARYSLATGEVTSYLQGSGITDAAQLASQQAIGFGFVTAADENFGKIATVDLATGQLMVYQAPIPVPDLLSQYIAYQINSGAIDAAAFHPASLAKINQSLASADMAVIATAKVSP